MPERHIGHRLGGALVIGLRRLGLRGVNAQLAGPARAGDAQQPTVDPAFEGRGIGAALMNAAIEAARGQGHELILLVGDAPYYARFGFKPVRPGQLVLPGPADPGRFLALELAEGVLARRSGAVTALR